MLSQRIGFAALTFTTIFGYQTLSADEATAKVRCGAGQILKVSAGTCMSRALAVKQGIIGSKRKATKESTYRAASALASEAADNRTNAADKVQNPEVTTVERTSAEAAQQPEPTVGGQDASARKPGSSAVMASASSAAVRIEVLKTEPRPTPAILTPTWPYGELAAFPRRVSP